MEIRLATKDDLPALRKVYRASVTAIGPSAYTDEQTDAWAQTADSQELANLLVTGRTYVAERDNRIAGFCTLEKDGRIALLYVLGEFARQGIGSALLAWALEHTALAAGTRLYAEASEFSLPLFQKFGFTLVETECSLWNGAEFLRYHMRKSS